MIPITLLQFQEKDWRRTGFYSVKTHFSVLFCVDFLFFTFVGFFFLLYDSLSLNFFESSHFYMTTNFFCSLFPKCIFFLSSYTIWKIPLALTGRFSSILHPLGNAAWITQPDNGRAHYHMNLYEICQSMLLTSAERREACRTCVCSLLALSYYHWCICR